MKANAIEMGDVEVLVRPIRIGCKPRVATYPRAIVLQFETVEMFKAALAAGKVEFTVFGQEVTS